MSESKSEFIARLRKEAGIQPFLISHLTFRYWKGPLHFMEIETDKEVTKITKIIYGDRPETEMIFICDTRGRVMELRNEDNELSMNAVTSTVHDKDHIEIIVRGLGEDLTIESPTIGYILQRVKTKDLSRNEARELAKKWLPLNSNPYVQKQIEEDLVAYGLLYAFEAEDRSITLEDLEIRYANIRRDYPEIRRCSVVGCKNPRDITMMGIDSSCAYHRLLFDAWSYDLDSDKMMYYIGNQRARRSAFTRWRNQHGEKTCDEFVLKLAQEGINWTC